MAMVMIGYMQNRSKSLFILAVAVFRAMVVVCNGDLLDERPTSASTPSRTEFEAAIDASDLIVVGHFQDRRNDRHAVARLFAPITMLGEFDTNKALVVNFSTQKDMIFVEREPAWIFFLLKSHISDANLEYCRVVALTNGFQGIVSGSPENIRLVKQLLASRNHKSRGLTAQPTSRTVTELASVLSSEESSESQKLLAIRDLKRKGTEALPAIPVLNKCLEDGALAAAAIETLALVGAEGIPSLIVGLKNKQEMVRLEAAAALGSFGSGAKEAVPALVVASDDSFEEVRVMAAVSLGRIQEGADLAVPALIRKLDDPESAVRQEAARALGQFGPRASEALPALLRVIGNSENPEARKAVHAIDSSAARTLGNGPALRQK